jgi:hypothetical protein
MTAYRFDGVDTREPVLMQTKYGFTWGAAIVERVMDNPKVGVVVCVRSVNGPRIYVRVSPGGRKINVERREQT